MKGRCWTDKELNDLEKYLKNGNTYSEIAKLMNRSYMAVFHKKSSLGHRSQMWWTGEETKKLIKLIGIGKNQTEIAEILGRPVGGVMVKCKSMGLKTKWARYLEEQKKRKKRGIKLCPRCKREKPRTKEFFRRGHGYCRDCEKETNLEYAYKSIETILQARLRAAKGRAIKKKLPFSIELNHLLSLWEKQQGKCFYTGLDMTYKHDNEKSLSVSLDRIIPSKGYMPDNITLCCWRVNMIKGELTIKEFYKWSELINSNKAQFKFSR